MTSLRLGGGAPPLLLLLFVIFLLQQHLNYLLFLGILSLLPPTSVALVSHPCTRATRATRATEVFVVSSPSFQSRRLLQRLHVDGSSGTRFHSNQQFWSASPLSSTSSEEGGGDGEGEGDEEPPANPGASIAPVSEFDANRAPLLLPYESAIACLTAYRRLNGNLAIPRRFVVPATEDYPPEWHNLPLSSTVYDMTWWSKHVKSKPKRVHTLNSLGFVWERLQPEWNLVLQALVFYRSIYGHIRVPPSFVVPSGNADGAHLGPYTNSDENSSSTNEPTGTDAKKNEWPVATWGIKLGSCVHRIRMRGDFLKDEYTSASRRSQLDGLGFVWDTGEEKYRRFYNALRVYAEMTTQSPPLRRNTMGGDQNGTTLSRRRRVRNDGKLLRVPSTYVVPSTSTIPSPDRSALPIPNPYPRYLWGYPLGRRCSAVRSKGVYLGSDGDGRDSDRRVLERRTELEQLGFRCGRDGGNAATSWLEVVHAAAIYSRVNGRVLDVPVGFVVPEAKGEDAVDGWPWPEQLWGLPLGQRLKDVRLKNAYLTDPSSCNIRRAQLDAMGFVWKPKRGRRKATSLDD